MALDQLLSTDNGPVSRSKINLAIIEAAQVEAAQADIATNTANIATNAANIATEITNRINDVNAEEAARIAAVSAEQTARIADVDAEEAARITAVSNEATARMSGDLAIDTKFMPLYNEVAYGNTAAPGAGTATMPESVVAYAEPTKSSGKIKRIRLYRVAAGTFRVQVRSRDDDDFTRVSTVNVSIPAGTGEIELTELDFGTITFAKNQHLGFQGTAGWLRYNTGNTSPLYAINSLDVLTMTDATESDAFAYEVQFFVEYDSGTVARLNTTVDKSLMSKAEIEALLLERINAGYTGMKGAFTSTAFSAAGWYLFNDNTDNAKVLRHFKFKAGANTFVYTYRAVVIGSTIRILEFFDPIKITNGQDVDINYDGKVTLKRGEFFGIGCPKAGWATFEAGAAASYKGFFYGAWTVFNPSTNEMAKSALFASNTIQMTLEYDEIIPSVDINALLGIDTQMMYVNKEIAPLTTSTGNLNGAAVAFRDVFKTRGILRKIEWLSNADAEVRWYVASVNGNTASLSGTTYTLQFEICPPTVFKSGNNVFYTNIIVEKGWVIVGQSPTAGWLRTNSATTQGYHFFVSSTYVDTWTATSGATNVQVEFRASMDPVGYGIDMHQLMLDECEEVGFIGQSFERGSYVPKGKDYVNRLNNILDYNVGNVAVGGQNMTEMLNLLRTNFESLGNRVKEINPTIAIWQMAKNDYLDGVLLTNFILALDQGIDTAEGLGAQWQIVASEWDEGLWGQSGYNAIQALTNHKPNTRFKSKVPTFRFLYPQVNEHLAQAAPFYNVAGSGWHPGVRRSSGLFKMWLDDIQHNFPKPKKGKKFFRMRSAMSPTSPSDLVFARDPDNFLRAKIWRAVYVGHIHLTDQLRYDTLSGADTTAFGALTFTNVNDENTFLKRGGSLAFGSNYAGMQLIFNATRRDVRAVNIQCAEATTEIWVMNSDLGAVVPALTSPTFNAVKVGTGNAWITDLSGKMRGDRMFVIFYNPSGVTMKEPRVFHVGTLGKNPIYDPPLPTPLGIEMLAQTHFNDLTNWTATGTITPTSTSDYGFPTGFTNYITVNASNYVTGDLTFAADPDVDRYFIVEALARRLPAVKLDPTSGPTEISEESFDMDRLEMSVLDPAGKIDNTTTATTEHIAYGRPPVELDWWWARTRHMASMGTSNLKLRLRSEGDVQLCYASSKWEAA